LSKFLRIELNYFYFISIIKYTCSYLGMDKNVEYICTSSKPDFFYISSYIRYNCKRVLCYPLVRPWNDIGVATDLAVSIQELISSPKTWMSYLVPYPLAPRNICPLYLVLLLNNERNTVTHMVINDYLFLVLIGEL